MKRNYRNVCRERKIDIYFWFVYSWGYLNSLCKIDESYYLV